MFKKLILAALVLLLAAQNAPAGELTARIQAQYEKLTAFKATFTQELTNGATKQKDTRTGRIFFAQPQLVRWETLKPEKELLVVGKEQVWDYFEDEKTAYKYTVAQVLSSKTMLRFISGKARLDEDFVVEEQGQDSGLTKLKLTPKNPEPGLVLAYIWVDPKTDLLARVNVIDFYGNSNLLTLSGLTVNPKLDAGLFKFQPPKGVAIQDGGQAQ